MNDIGLSINASRETSAFACSRCWLPWAPHLRCWLPAANTLFMVEVA